MPIDYGTPVGQTRLLIPDVNEADLIFDDEQIDGFLTLSGGDVYYAAASAIRVIASNDLMLFTVAIRSDDGSIGNVAETAKVMLKRAEDLEKGLTGIGFDLVGGEEYRWLWGRDCLWV